jgi:hypothetical protein
MSSFVVRLRGQVARFGRVDAPLTATALLMLGLLGVFVAGLWLDPRMLLGAPLWLKPAKFAASIAIYCLTLVWVFGFIPAQVRTRRFVSRVTVAAMLLEMGIIALQAARGTTSHFNVSTPLNAALFSVMGITIVAQTLTSTALAVALFRQRFEDGALGWALRLGMVIAIAGAFLGGVMTRPTQDQLAQMQAGRPSVAGAHTVGAADGGAAVPVTGWSREHGDLRVGHFLGLHALQVLPLLALALRRTRASRAQRARLVFTLAGSYVGAVAIAFWQGLRGQPLVAPDASTLAALAAWATLTTLLTWHALSRRAQPNGNLITVS